MLDEELLLLTKPYINTKYVQRACERSSSSRKKFAYVISQGRLPELGFPEHEIEALFLQLASLDSNNWENSVGVGEREGRVLVNFVRRRHYGLTHGIGRSGDVTDIQPKAPGSSIINRLTNQLLLDWLKKSGSPSTSNCFLVPMATGMSLTLCLLALKKRRPPNARFVIWPRIDQKSCFKCMIACDLIPVPIEPIVITGTDQLICDLKALKQALNNPAVYLLENWPDVAKAHDLDSLSAPNYGPDSVVCVLSTTTCFAPRVPDKLYAITKECIQTGVSHLVNNAYGVQSPRCMRMIEAAGELILEQDYSACSDSNKLDKSCLKMIDFLYVQSTDKNLMVPVGGAIIAGFNTDLINYVAKLYPGRASASPSIDVLSTLLHIGYKGWMNLVHSQSECFSYFKNNLIKLANKYGLNLMKTDKNPISLALNLNGLISNFELKSMSESNRNELISKLTQIGANLFTQGCSGVRIVLPATMQKPTKLDLYEFQGFNSHHSLSDTPYLNVASAIGQKKTEIDLFLERLDKSIQQFKHSSEKFVNDLTQT